MTTRAPRRLKISLPLLLWVYLGAAVLLVGIYFTVPAVSREVNQVYGLLIAEDRNALERWVAGFGLWGPVLILALMIGQVLLSAVPMVWILLISVLAYGPLWGGLLGVFGAMLASWLGYYLARALGPVVVDRFVSAPLRRKVEAAVERYGAWAVLALRLSPLIPSDGVSFVAGLVKLSALKFSLATLGGIVPITLGVAWLGEDLDRLGPVLVIATVLSLGALVGVVLWDRLRPSRGEV